ncbi:MAG: transglutaminase family protein [Planctomycetaceae bacterium]
MNYRVTHTTCYTGDEPISVGHNEAWLKPRSGPRQQTHKFHLHVDPVPAVTSLRTDSFGNDVHVFSFNEGYRQLKVTAVSEIGVQPPPVPSAMKSPPWEAIREQLRSTGGAALPAAEQPSFFAYEFAFPSPRIFWDDSVVGFAEVSFVPGRPIVDAVQDLTSRMHAEFKYDGTATTVSTPVKDVFQLRRGVCQDFAHLQIAAIRSVGLAARYVSGYLRTFPPPGKPRLVGADASHAWLSVFCGELGWLDVDPTNNMLVRDEHITLAWGRDYGDVPPLTGVFIGGGQHRMSVSVDVLPLE